MSKGKSGKGSMSSFSAHGSKRLRSGTRVRASDIRRGDSLVFRGTDNRRVRFVERFYGSVNAPERIYVGIANAEGTAFEMRDFKPTERVLIAR